MYGPSQLIVIWLVLQETRGEGEREKTREEGEDIPVHRGVVRFLPACSFVHAPGRQDTHELLAVPSVIDTCLCFVTQYSQPVTDVAIVLLDAYTINFSVLPFSSAPPSVVLSCCRAQGVAAEPNNMYAGGRL